MPFGLGGAELLLILVLVLIVFGAGKLPTVFGQLGRGVRTFRDEADRKDEPLTSTTAGTTAPTGATKYCSKCGKPSGGGARFCASCGSPLAA